MRPECEQHYTPARDNQYRATARYYKECCPYCEIDRLKRELEDAKDEAFKREARIMMYVNKNLDLERQLDASQALLAEARAENESIGYKPLAAIKEEVRQETARERLEIVKQRNCFTRFILSDIKHKFKLEG